VDVAENGVAALERLEQARYDVVLMDCQMPVLDGYEATRRWRAREKRGERVPIVALTAQALAGDEARCREAGMDDYLTKPFERRALIALLERLLPASGAWPRAAAAAPRAQTADSGDDAGAAASDLEALEAFLQAFGQRVGADGLRRVMNAVTRHMPGQLDELRALAGGADAQGLAKLAHTLRGASYNIGLEELGGKLAEVERTSATDLKRARALATEVERRLRSVCATIAARADAS
jgi:CheY-like chemotaxis protein/HPt (histidine-containing phosphotransfer) domain-containing protein